MSNPQVISNYQVLSGITGQMREAAIQGEWDKLVLLEEQCSLQVSTMRPLDASAQLDEPERQQKISLIKQILADDREIRNRTESWMAQLQRLMQSNRQEQRLHQAYSAGY